ncbi:COX15/CtaA family protein [Rubritalea marina]|uniref:COX15/CtaA family protein n=1 Tax=Rubritalea marina TaxID=361055 RepID=UPI0014615DF7|nr:COX15/CtaA family protein [Rubritalea marina]
MTVFQKVALLALIFTLLLMFVGAIVRATGAGMGCPDWPKCWGQYIPPTSVEQIDPDSLPIEKYQEKAERHGRDPAEVTRENVLAEFNPVHTWTEFINRLCSLPIGLFTLLTLILSFQFIRKRPWLPMLATLATFLVGLNAWMGARIVYSGLKPGTITTHMALAILLLCVQVTIVWLASETRWRIQVKESGKHLKWVGLAAFLFIIGEGILGSQVREMTDELKKSHGDAPRIEWSAELEQTWMYLVHRSFSWAVLLVTAVYYWTSRNERVGGAGWHEKLMAGFIFLQMVFGLILSQVGILPVIQVLHIGISSLMVTVFFHWLLGAFARHSE